MKKHLYIWLLTLSLFYLFHLSLKFAHTPVPQWFSSYFADFLCLPIIFSYTLIWIRYIKKTPNFLLSSSMLFVGWGITSLLFELILPSFSKRYTADIFDVAAYALGAIFYLVNQKVIFKN